MVPHWGGCKLVRLYGGRYNRRVAGLGGPTGHESIAWVTFPIGNRPHKALPRSALLEKHPVRRVGGAEGAEEITLLRFNLVRGPKAREDRSTGLLGNCYPILGTENPAALRNAIFGRPFRADP
jgi:hypothetical protein